MIKISVLFSSFLVFLFLRPSSSRSRYDMFGNMHMNWSCEFFSYELYEL
jgi:hypothetical protein